MTITSNLLCRWMQVLKWAIWNAVKDNGSSVCSWYSSFKQAEWQYVQLAKVVFGVEILAHLSKFTTFSSIPHLKKESKFIWLHYRPSIHPSIHCQARRLRRISHLLFSNMFPVPPNLQILKPSHSSWDISFQQNADLPWSLVQVVCP